MMMKSLFQSLPLDKLSHVATETGISLRQIQGVLVGVYLGRDCTRQQKGETATRIHLPNSVECVLGGCVLSLSFLFFLPLTNIQL